MDFLTVPHHRAGSQSNADPPAKQLTGDWTEVQVVDLTNDGSGLGFGIVGGRSTGVVVKTILPGSPTDRDGRLRQGDHLLQIGHINLHGMSSQQVAMILRQQDANVRIVVGRPTTAASPAPLTTDAAAAASTSTTPAVPPSNDDCITISTREALCAATLDEQLDAHKRATSLQPSPSTAAASAETRSPSAPRVASSSRAASVNSQHGQSAKTPEREMRQSEEDTYSDRKGATGSLRPDRGLEDMALTSFCRENWLPDQTETVVVDLVRDEQLGLGITVAGYVHRKGKPGAFVICNEPGALAAYSSGFCDGFRLAVGRPERFVPVVFINAIT
uniref:PDZ domain-containing protein n=1 Tax=Plectus sambesii TaxID=2011161 RepID=A0A914WJ43_9BILA